MLGTHREKTIKGRGLLKLNRYKFIPANLNFFCKDKLLFPKIPYLASLSTKPNLASEPPAGGLLKNPDENF